MNKIKQIFYKIYRLSWKITQPQTVGVRAILIKNNKILLVKHTYSDQWFLPGGGLKKGEKLENAIKRELNEELGVEVNEINLHGAYQNFYEGKRDYIIVFKTENFEIFPKKDQEIEQYEFFDFLNIPEKTSPGTRKRIKELLENKMTSHGDW